MLENLALLLKNAILDGHLLLTSRSPLPPEASQLLRWVPDQSLALEQPSVELVGESLVIKGRVSTDWSLSGRPAAALSQIDLLFTISASTASPVSMETRGLLVVGKGSLPFCGRLDSTLLHWQIQALGATTVHLTAAELLSIPWADTVVASLDPAALRAIRLKGLERFEFEWDPAAAEPFAYPVHIQGQAELYGLHSRLVLNGGPTDLAVRAEWAGDLLAKLQGQAERSLHDSMQEALADLRELEEFAKSLGGEATVIVGQAEERIKRIVDRVGELKGLPGIKLEGGDHLERLERLPGLVKGMGRTIDLLGLREKVDWLLKLESEVKRVSKSHAQARLEKANKAVPILQAKLAELEGQVTAQVAALDAVTEGRADAQALAAEAVQIYRAHLAELRRELHAQKGALGNQLRGLLGESPSLGAAFSLLEDGPRLMALLGARQAARDELRALELQLQYLQENADGDVKLPSHLHPAYLRLVVERSDLRRQLTTEQALQATLGMIIETWPQKFDDLMKMVPGLIMNVKWLVESALGDEQRWNEHLLAIQVALGGEALFQIHRAELVAPVVQLAGRRSEVQVEVEVNGKRHAVRLLCDPRDPVATSGRKLANVIFDRLAAKEDVA